MRVISVVIPLFTALIFWILVSRVFAASTPTISEPASGSTINDSSPKLSWISPEVCPSNGSCYMVEVDNNSDFSSPEKNNIYTNNLYYSPQALSEGSWFWRVKAKDVSGNWSDWTSASFTISLNASPLPSAVSNPVEVSSSPLPSPSTLMSQGGTSQFQIQSSTNMLDVNSTAQITVNLVLPSNPNQSFYLKGAFIKSGGSNYFGKTKVSGSWVENSSSYSSQNKIITDSSGNWNGVLEVMPDPEDSGYSGSGNYKFKVSRYSTSGSGPTWSNELSFSLSGSAISPASQTKTTTTTSSTKPSGTPSSLSASTNKPNSSPASTIKTDSVNIKPQIASVAAEATDAASIQTDSSQLSNSLLFNEVSANWYYIFSGLILLSATATALILKYKQSLVFLLRIKHQ